MNRFNSLLLATAILVGHSSCHVHNPTEILPEISQSPIVDQRVDHSYAFLHNGKAKGAKRLASTYTEQNIPEGQYPAVDPTVIQALQHQLKSLKYKKRKKDQKIDNLDVSIAQLKETINILIKTAKNPTSNLSDLLDAHQIKGKDGKGNVHFTGYYTPVLEVRREKDALYKYPIYSYPKEWEGKLPSRQQIDGEKVLKDFGLELAYAKSAIDIYFMQVQGSGIVAYEDGTETLFSYSGSNRHSYRSIGRYMVKKGWTTAEHASLKAIKNYLEKNPEMTDSILYANPSYVFFEPSKSSPKGAGLVPLTTVHSIAVDTRYIPLGSVLLAAVPIVNNKNRVIRHDYRFLVAQDVGGAINGPGHIDLYTGIGETARRKASALHHYGSLWLLLPNAEEKDNTLAMKD